MVNRIQILDLNNYSKSTLREILDAIERISPMELGIKDLYQSAKNNWSIEEIGLSNKNINNKEFENLIKRSTGENSIRRSYAKIYELWQVATNQTEKILNASLPDEEARKLQELERQRRETEVKEAKEKGEREVEEVIKKKQELYEQYKKAEELKAALKDKKVYYKVEKNSVEENPHIENLREQGEKDPKRFIEDSTKYFSKNQILENKTAEEALPSAKSVAVATFDTLESNSPLLRAALINQLASNPEILNKFIPASDQAVFKNFASILYEQELSRFTLANQFINLSKIDGYEDIKNIKIQFSTTPQEGFKEFDINQNIILPSIQNLDAQNYLINNIGNIGAGELKSQVFLTIGGQLNSYIAQLPADSLLASTYNSEVVQLGLSSLGLVEAAPWVAAEGSFFGKIVVSSGYGPVAGLIQNKLGIDLGVKLATPVVEVAAGQVTGEIAAGSIGAAAGTGASVAIGQVAVPIPVVGAAIGAAASWLINKAAKLIPWNKIKENAPIFAALIFGGGAYLVTGSLTAGIFTGLGAAGVTSIATGGTAGLGSLVAGIGHFFLALGEATLGAIGKPILITLLSLPIAVALILLIINSGAYVVPISTNATFVGKIHCTEEKETSGIYYSTSSPIATRALHIVDDLYQGFWCYWNRSPKAPVEYFPKDVLLYPPGYPDLFDYKLFLTNPDPPESSGPNLFWCTYLVLKAYKENKVDVPNELNTQTMFDKWKFKKISANQATSSNILPGSVVFFHVTTGPARLNHVGIVYSVDPGGIVIVESNGPLKTQTINFKSSGSGVGDLPLMEVKYFGLPS